MNRDDPEFTSILAVADQDMARLSDFLEVLTDSWRDTLADGEVYEEVRDATRAEKVATLHSLLTGLKIPKESALALLAIVIHRACEPEISASDLESMVNHAE